MESSEAAATTPHRTPEDGAPSVGYGLRASRPADAALFQAIERSAAQCFRTLGPPLALMADDQVELHL